MVYEWELDNPAGEADQESVRLHYDAMRRRRSELMQIDLAADDAADDRREWTALMAALDTTLRRLHVTSDCGDSMAAYDWMATATRDVAGDTGRETGGGGGAAASARSSKSKYQKAFSIDFDEEGCPVDNTDDLMEALSSGRPKSPRRQKVKSGFFSDLFNHGSARQYVSPRKQVTKTAGGAEEIPSKGGTTAGSQSLETGEKIEELQLRDGLALMERKLDSLVAAGKFSAEDAAQILRDAMATAMGASPPPLSPPLLKKGRTGGSSKATGGSRQSSPRRKGNRKAGASGASGATLQVFVDDDWSDGDLGLG